ncbi:PD-(D/E)XK nuclease family protein [Ralstonia sp. 25C]|uniref:PD-(D/E)XK nuclease family protein n=1 Tax=Ralstonia sp. 25C TaxID=3447363 RepID=UPI003F753755
MSTPVDTFRVRASSFGRLMDCAHSWEWTYIDGKGKPAGLRALLGIALHASTATNDQALIEGRKVTPLESAAVFVDELNHPKQEVDYGSDDLTKKEAQTIGLALHTMYCTTVAPHMRYIDVETKLTPMPIQCGGVIIELTGTMDRARVCETARGPVIPDLKSGRGVVVNGMAKIKGRSAQLGIYQLLYEHTKNVRTAGAQVIGLGTTSKPAVAVSQVFDARRVIVGDNDSPGLIEYAADMFRTGLFPPNPSSVLCDKRYCARWDSCKFHE